MHKDLTFSLFSLSSGAVYNRIFAYYDQDRYLTHNIIVKLYYGVILEINGDNNPVKKIVWSN